MKSLHFVQSIEPLQGGGLGQAALGLHHATLPLGPSKLVTTCAAGTPEVPGVLQFARKGLSSFYYSPTMTGKARELVSDTDWVHGHGLYVGTNAILGSQAIKQNKPLCYHVHGFFDPWILNRSQWKKRLVRYLFEDRNFRNVRLWRALTLKEADQIRATGMKQTVAILPNGIRLEEIDQLIAPEETARFDQRSRPKRILFLGRLHPKKGLDILVRAWTNLAKQFPDWELMIVGPDEGGYLTTVKEMIKNGGIEGHVQFTGSVSGSTKAAAFRSSDLFVLPSYSEGFPVAVVEAAAHGLPSVITAECNFPELTQVGAAWECLPTSESFTSVLALALQADDLERKQRGEKGRALIELKYTWPNIAKDMYNICKSLD